MYIYIYVNDLCERVCVFILTSPVPAGGRSRHSLQLKKVGGLGGALKFIYFLVVHLCVNIRGSAA